MASIGGEEEAAAAVRVIGGWASHYAIRVYVALKLKGVEYEFLQEVVGNKSELLLQSNPVHKKIPVLLHHGKPVAESMIILQYIDEVWASNNGRPAILSPDPYERAVQRFWAQYVDDKVTYLKSYIHTTADFADESEIMSVLRGVTNNVISIVDCSCIRGLQRSDCRRQRRSSSAGV